MIDDGQPQKPQTINIELCDYIDRQILNLDAKWKIRHDSLAEEYQKSERVRQEAKQDMDKRLEAMNEFRAQLGKQAQTFITGKEADSKIKLALAYTWAIMIAVLTAMGIFIVNLAGRI